MNIHDPNIATPKVTTGPISGSRKVYARPEARLLQGQAHIALGQLDEEL